MQVLGFYRYSDYLASPHWRSVRVAYRNAAHLPQNCVCGADEVELHHRTYERLGEERLADLYPLCRACHQLFHSLVRRGLLPLDADPDEVLRDDARAQCYAAERAALAARAVEEFGGLKEPGPLDRHLPKGVLAFRERCRSHARARARQEHRRRVRLSVAQSVGPEDHARPIDLQHRVFDP